MSKIEEENKYAFIILNNYIERVMQTSRFLDDIKDGEKIIENEKIEKYLDKPFLISLLSDVDEEKQTFLYKEYEFKDLIKKSLKWFNDNQSKMNKEGNFITILSVYYIYQSDEHGYALLCNKLCTLVHKEIVYKNKNWYKNIGWCDV